MGSDQVVLSVLVLRLDHVKFVIFLVLDFLDLVFQERDFSVESLVFKFGFTSHVLKFKVLFLDFILEFSDVELLQLVVAKLRPFQGLNLVQGFIFVPILELTDFDLFHVFNVNNLIVEPIDFGDKFFDLYLVFVILDVEVVKHFLLFGFGEVGMSVFVVKLLFK